MKKEKKSKEAPKQVEEKISLNYSKSELKKAKEIAREKQREADIQRNLGIFSTSTFILFLYY